MNRKSNLSKINWPQVISIVIALAGLILGGGFFYNEVWKSKVLTYTVLPNYDLGGQSFSGLVIANRGRAPLTDVGIILSNLEVPIGRLNLPGPHEPAQVVSGGEGHTELSIEMPRFSSGAPPLPIYIVTSDTLTLEEGKTFFVSSKEVAGTHGKDETSRVILVMGLLWFISILVCGSYMLSLQEKHARQSRERFEQFQKEYSEKWVELFNKYAEGLITLQEAVKRLRKADDDHESN